MDTLPPQLPTSCDLCPRRCSANRRAGQRGACGADDQLMVARAALHEWEEPPISVGAGSGTVFFSNCPLRCIYCQNAQIARGAHGSAVSADRLAQIFWELREKGAANVNLVTPTHYLPFVLHSVAQARSEGFDLPFVCNTSGYETVDTIWAMHGSIDIYLTDFKYWKDGESSAARRYSNAPDYFEIAMDALDAMVESAGAPRFDHWSFDGADPEPRLIGGVVVRHLMLPGCLDDSRRIMAHLWSRYGDGVLYSVMNQYTPLSMLPLPPELRQRVANEDYELLLDYLDNLGMTDYFWQQGDAALESFIPPFDNTGV